MPTNTETLANRVEARAELILAAKTVAFTATPTTDGYHVADTEMLELIKAIRAFNRADDEVRRHSGHSLSS